ncbi:MAG TPA: hypothetical protein VGW38_18960 [Chloroflexota bacterium]|nr:hypothetical protein [Chloroflexota bacterium]
MRRYLALLTAFLLALGVGLPAGANSVSAQAPTWVRGYPSEGNPAFGMTAGCVYYVAQWSDGSYTSVPWDCDPGVVARDGDRTSNRGYPQLAANGCTEYITQWNDGTYSWVPFSCPQGITYFNSAGNLVPKPAQAGGKEFVRVPVVAQDGVIEVSATVPTGRVAFAFQNAMSQPFFAGMVRLHPGVTPAEFLATVEDQEAALRLATAVGAPAFLAPEETQEIIYDLPAGSYLIFSFGEDGPESAMVASFQAVPPAMIARPPATVGEIVMRDFSFQAPAIPAGTNTFRVTNAGSQLHHMIVARLAPDLTLQEALAMEEQGIDPVEAGLVQPVKGLSELSPGQSAWPTLTFTPGNYAMICFITDPASGLPHVALGMAQEFTVAP